MTGVSSATKKSRHPGFGLSLPYRRRGRIEVPEYDRAKALEWVAVVSKFLRGPESEYY